MINVCGRRARTRELPVVDRLDDRVWSPRLASVNVRSGAPFFLLQFRDDEVFQARVNAYIDMHGEIVEDAGEEEEEEEEDEYDDPVLSEVSSEEHPPKMSWKRSRAGSI